MNRRNLLKNSTLALGYALTGSTLAGLLGGCKADPKSDWVPQFFTPAQGVTIAEICERILPKTDTPGAKDLLVHRFIDSMVQDYFSPKEQEMMRNGMAEFEADCQKKHGNSFPELKPEQQDAVLTKWEQQSPKLPPKVWGSTMGVEDLPSFYRKLKELCLVGYFQSETVGETILNYVQVPGKYEGCVPLAEVGNAWAL